MAISLQLPTLQNWSCHTCSGCCRQHAIEVTEAERQRIVGQHWEQVPETAGPLFVWHAGPFWNKRYRLAHRPDGACVFLDPQGLCRIHAKFGEPAKPLACRVYPYAFHPAGKQITVSLRFSCPSVTANRGKPLKDNLRDIRELAELVVPAGVERIPPPAISKQGRVDWSDFHRIRAAVETGLTPADVPLIARLTTLRRWLKLVGAARFDKIAGRRLEEFLGLVISAAEGDAAGDEASAAPHPVARVYLRQAAGQYARADTAVELARGWRTRWANLTSGWRFARGTGLTPAGPPPLRPVPFAEVERPYGPLSAEIEELLTRYLLVKVQGLHFCGRAYYDVPFVEGFDSLVLLVAATLWIARWEAASAGRTALQLSDVQHALNLADHHHGYSPLLGLLPFRTRVRWLAQTDELDRLLAWLIR